MTDSARERLAQLLSVAFTAECYEYPDATDDASVPHYWEVKETDLSAVADYLLAHGVTLGPATSTIEAGREVLSASTHASVMEGIQQAVRNEGTILTDADLGGSAPAPEPEFMEFQEATGEVRRIVRDPSWKTGWWAPHPQSNAPGIGAAEYHRALAPPAPLSPVCEVSDEESCEMFVKEMTDKIRAAGWVIYKPLSARRET